MFHIVDVDNTLVFTNQLNTAGYVYALAQVGLEPRTCYTGPHYAGCGAQLVSTAHRPRIRIYHIP